ncbi:MAG: gamma carbonic anhydrase family protein [Magnetococcales bacterium]|nr:gamma carbonic anhydrase family protein [Magnetococcales bacterium]
MKKNKKKNVPTISPFQGSEPQIDPTAYIHPSAVIIGHVTIGAYVSIWPGVIIRGDVNHIRIGARTNIQDGVVLHVCRPTGDQPKGYPLIIGEGITIGHRVVLHGCQVGDGCLIGASATVLDGAVLGEEAMIGAGSLVTPRTKVGTQELWLGSPAKMRRHLEEKELVGMRATTDNYIQLANQYRDTEPKKWKGFGI